MINSENYWVNGQNNHKWNN